MNIKLISFCIAVFCLICFGFTKLVAFLGADAAYYCKQRWVESGLSAKQTHDVGCLVQLKDGKWYPERNVKVGG